MGGFGKRRHSESRVPQTFELYCEDYSLNLLGEFLQLPNFKNLIQINRLGIEHSRERQLTYVEGGYMKSTIFAVALLAAGLLLVTHFCSAARCAKNNGRCQCAWCA